MLEVDSILIIFLLDQTKEHFIKLSNWYKIYEEKPQECQVAQSKHKGYYN